MQRVFEVEYSVERQILNERWGGGKDDRRIVEYLFSFVVLLLVFCLDVGRESPSNGEGFVSAVWAFEVCGSRFLWHLAVRWTVGERELRSAGIVLSNVLDGFVMVL